MAPAIIDPDDKATVADNESQSEKKEPQKEIDDEGRNVFCGYSFKAGADEDDFEADMNETASLACSDIAMDDASSANDAATHASGLPAEEDTDIDFGGCSASSESTHLRDSSMGGHTTEPSTDPSSAGHMSESSADANDQTHSKEPSIPLGMLPASKLDSLIEDEALPSIPPAIEEVVHEHEEEDWDVVENDGGEAHNGGRRKGQNFFQRGIADRYVLRIATAIRPTPPRRSSTRRFAFHSRLSSSRSSVDSSAESPTNSMPRLHAARTLSEESSRPKAAKLRNKASRASLRSPQQASRAGTPVSTTSDQTLPATENGSPVQKGAKRKNSKRPQFNTLRSFLQNGSPNSSA